MTDILTVLSPSSLTIAIKANLYAFFQRFPHSAKAEFYSSSQLLRWHTQVAHPFNGVLSLQLPTADVTQAVRDSLSYFESCTSPASPGG